MLLITGKPGVGKTTVCLAVHERLIARGLLVDGFVTRERREHQHQQRTGFDVVALTTMTASPLASLSTGAPPPTRGVRHAPRVGKWAVAVPEFEAAVLPILARRPRTADRR